MPTTQYAHNALGQRVFKTEPLYAPVQGDNAGFLGAFTAFIGQLWNPATDAEKLGYAYVYDEAGSLIGEYGMGGAYSAGNAKYVYLPTANGPMPVMAFVGGRKYAVHTDHLNTPRRLTRANGKPAWQWSYSAFGEVPPTTAARRFTDEMTIPTTGQTNVPEVEFNLRYPGQYFDKESGLSYNYFRSYDSRIGRYTQNDPIGLNGGWNRFGYVDANPLLFMDPLGLQRSGGGGYGSPFGRPAYVPSAREVARSDGGLPSGPPSIAESGGIATPRSLMNQFTNEPNPSPRLPGDYVGVNYPWSMPRLANMCDQWEPAPAPDTNESICRPSDDRPKMTPLRCVAWRTIEVR